MEQLWRKHQGDAPCRSVTAETLRDAPSGCGAEVLVTVRGKVSSRK
jgi:hypothetical protein